MESRLFFIHLIECGSESAEPTLNPLTINAACLGLTHSKQKSFSKTEGTGNPISAAVLRSQRDTWVQRWRRVCDTHMTPTLHHYIVFGQLYVWNAKKIDPRASTKHPNTQSLKPTGLVSSHFLLQSKLPVESVFTLIWSQPPQCESQPEALQTESMNLVFASL